jgi:hypothetical protein
MAAGKKTGGRQAGTPNKVTARLRDKIETFLSVSWKDIADDFKELEPKDRIALYERLLQYAIPRQNNINVTSQLQAMLSNLDEVTLTEIAEEIIKLHNQN